MKILKYYFSFFFSIIAFPQLLLAGENYTITGNISGNVEGKKVYLFSDARYLTPLDSSVIEKGVFKMKGIVSSPHLYNILIAEDGKKKSSFHDISFFLESGNIVITANLDSVPTLIALQELRYPYNKVKITGSKSHDLFVKYFDENLAFRKKINQANNNYFAYLKEKKEDNKEDVDRGIKLTIAIDEARKERNEYIERFVKNNTESPVSLVVIEMNLSYFNTNEIATLFSRLSVTLKKDPYWSELEQKAFVIKKTAEGANYTDFSFLDKDDNKIKLSDYLGKGKYVLLELWASWCNPCIQDLPHLKAAYSLYHPLGFEIIQISMDNNKEQWLKAVNEYQMNWLQISDLKSFVGDFAKTYGIDSIPTCILIGPDGKILDRNMRESWMDRRLIELYGNKFADN